jgi:DNA-3-methyladenine glycosylase I
MKTRCTWPGANPLMIAYHDEEWGVPLSDDSKWFEFLVLDAFQAGLSWQTVLNKRENFRAAFDQFDYTVIANYSDEKLDVLGNDTGIIRNKLKIKATKTNAQAFMEIQHEFGSFDAYIWKFTDNKTIDNGRRSMDEITVNSPESDAMSKDLKKRGFKFVGSTICYAFMQAAGMVNDHVLECFRYKEISGFVL